MSHISKGDVLHTITTRVRGLAPWRPQRATLDLLTKVQGVLIEYHAYLPLTVRQVFYRLVGVYDYDKTEQAYARLCEHLNRARRASIIPFDAIRDDGITLAEPVAWVDGDQFLRNCIAYAEQFRLDRQEGQPVRLIFAVEAAGMLPQVQRIADPFGIAVHSSGGFDSVTAKYELAKTLGRWPRVEVLHIGDHDPSGVHLYKSMAEDVQAIARDLGVGSEIRFSRLAVTPAQITELSLSTAPPKPTDQRSFTGETVQCEAIAPDVLADIIRAAIEDRFDATAYASVREEEDAARKTLGATLRPLLKEFGQ
jgi:hypothetical protein